jgi:uncharacterized protein
MTMTRTDPPTPARLAQLHPDGITGPFWEAAASHRLVCQRCVGCATRRLPPTSHCHRCRSASYEWVELPGTGIVYSFTVTRHAFVPYLRDCVPYTIVLVELDEAPGVRLIAQAVAPGVDDIRIGDAVTVVWDDAGDGVTVPKAQRTSA